MKLRRLLPKLLRELAGCRSGVGLELVQQRVVGAEGVGEALEEVRLHGQLVADLLGVGMDFAVLVAQEVEVTLVEVAGAADVEAVGALE